MTPEAFRQDRFLRTSGYNLAVWGPVNLFLSLPAYAGAVGAAWNPQALFCYGAVLVLAAIALMLVNERRAERVLGEPSSDTPFNAARLWSPVLVATFALAFALQLIGLGQFVMPLWMIVTGIGFLMWGLMTVHVYAWMGACIMLSGSLVLAWQSGVEAPNALASIHLWNIAMGAGFIAASIAVNTDYLWNDERPV